MQVIADCLSEEEIAGLKEMFKMLDADNSGHITYEELKVGLEKAGANLKDSEIYDLMQAVSMKSKYEYHLFISANNRKEEASILDISMFLALIY